MSDIKSIISKAIETNSTLDSTKRAISRIGAQTDENIRELDTVSTFSLPNGRHLSFASFQTNYKEVDLDKFIEELKEEIYSHDTDAEVFYPRDSKRIFIRHPLFTAELEFGFSLLKASEEKEDDVYFVRVVSTGAFGVIEAHEAWNVIYDKFHDKDLEKKLDAQAMNGSDRDGEKVYKVNFDALSFINGSPEVTSHVYSTDDFKDVRYEFYPKIRVEAMMGAFARSSSNVLILLGPPGTGKTSMMRRSIADLAITLEKDVRVMSIKDPAILEEDVIYDKLNKVNPDFVLLDDMDQGLEDRKISETAPGKGDGNPLMNKLLSFTNGAIKNNIKVIITTNRDVNRKEDIDSALVRPGRCFNVIKIPELDWGEAVDLWVNHYQLPLEGFRKLFPQEDCKIPQAMLSQEAELYGEFEAQSYLLDESISVRDFYQSDVIKPERAEPVSDKRGKEKVAVGVSMMASRGFSSPLTFN